MSLLVRPRTALRTSAGAPAKTLQKGTLQAFGWRANGVSATVRAGRTQGRA
jgi:hypothetical protein